MFNLAAQYDDVINLTLGDPDIIPPECIRQAGCDAIMEGKTRYSANAGLVELRKTYSKYLNYTYGRKFDYQTQIAVTVGGMEALYLALLSSIDPGDELLREKHVAVVPGIAYGDDFDDYIRIAFTMKETVIKEAARRIVEFVEK